MNTIYLLFAVLFWLWIVGGLGWQQTARYARVEVGRRERVLAWFFWPFVATVVWLGYRR